jgi:hypothetical protein
MGPGSLLCAFCSPSAREACARKIPALLNFHRFRLGSSLLCAARWLSMIQARLPPNLASPPLASCPISAAIECDSASVVWQRRFGTSPIDQGRSERRSRGKVVAIRVMLSEGESRKRRCLTAKMRCCSGRERERERAKDKSVTCSVAGRLRGMSCTTQSSFGAACCWPPHAAAAATTTTASLVQCRPVGWPGRVHPSHPLALAWPSPLSASLSPSLLAITASPSPSSLSLSLSSSSLLCC